MENSPRKVRVVIESSTGNEHISQDADGELYAKGNHYYLRYNEASAEMARTVTTIRLGPDSIRVIRQGALRSEQTFVRGQRLHGYYDTPQGKLGLETKTDALAVDLIDGLGVVEWSYELYVMGELSGTYRLRLTVSARG
ncbi:DUF1934 domain-containing protein [Paenibacillus xerothermodurans]|uniref:DUF1934 domain-containing protein n=1 Tax=Paenibacillus xerothermodurans TaxID=1977292 RepID=A0A2W1NWQ4_PAEXE|nr:DUF1934 domain-containing protein [Paenibacillus xerothermodurans]PZE20102.1 DUF1934 domain-containing protein [Paenibacillus xerothermodurans]